MHDMPQFSVLRTPVSARYWRRSFRWSHLSLQHGWFRIISVARCMLCYGWPPILAWRTWNTGDTTGQVSRNTLSTSSSKS